MHMPDALVMEEFKRKLGGPKTLGIGICGGPFEMEMVLDYTGLRGSGSNIYHTYIYKAPKWGFSIKKVDEWIEVTPSWAEYYNITIAQKQKLEASIKSGLTSATQAISDYELLSHDARRYKEILDYFVEGKTDEHVLRSLFVDRVDAYTGEGYSMVTMAKRWPTIITDFIRMKTEWTDPKVVPEGKQIQKIMHELDVSQAEATVLKTKNQLYREWKTMFLPVVKDRYARIQAMVNARRKSIDEYKSWLKPYVARYKMIREKEELQPSSFVSDAYITPGFGQSQAITGVKLWVWKPFSPAEKGKPEAVLEKKGFVVDPYDDLVKEWQKKIEAKYNIKFTEEDIRNILDDALSKRPDRYGPEMSPDSMYYVLFDINVILNLLKTPPPEGIETDNLMVYPIKLWVVSQNILLLHLMEIKAREMALDKYVNEMIGARELEEEIAKRVEEQFKEKKPERFQSWKSFTEKTSAAGRRLKSGVTRFTSLFMKPGPYENNFEERITKMYFRAAGPLYGQHINFLKEKMNIPV
jgi:hypothetical protein